MRLAVWPVVVRPRLALSLGAYVFKAVHVPPCGVEGAVRCKGQGVCLWARPTGQHESTLWFSLGHGFLVDGLVESLRCCAQGEHESGSRG